MKRRNDDSEAESDRRQSKAAVTFDIHDLRKKDFVEASFDSSSQNLSDSDRSAVHIGVQELVSPEQQPSPVELEMQANMQAIKSITLKKSKTQLH